MKHSNTNKVGACNAYVVSGLPIKTKTCDSKIDVLKEIMRAWGMNPKEILAKKRYNSVTAYTQRLPFVNVYGVGWVP